MCGGGERVRKTIISTMFIWHAGITQQDHVVGIRYVASIANERLSRQCCPSAANRKDRRRTKEQYLLLQRESIGRCEAKQRVLIQEEVTELATTFTCNTKVKKKTIKKT